MIRPGYLSVSRTPTLYKIIVMTTLSAPFLLLTISGLLIGMLTVPGASAQDHPDSEEIARYEKILLEGGHSEEFEEARLFLNRYYRSRVTNNEENVPDYKLPELLISDDGRVIESAEQWTDLRREEILKLFKENVYGKVPGFEYEMAFIERSADRQALGGLATRKQVSIRFHQNGKELPENLTIDLLIYLPNHTEGPVPAMMGLNFYGNQTIHPDDGIHLSTKWMRPNEDLGIIENRATEKSRGYYLDRWRVEDVVRRGYALVTAYAGDIEPDDPSRMRQGVRYLAYGETGEPAADEWGTIAAWAWGLSRMLDYLETDDQIDYERVMLMGHSRLGKAALWAGATDERFAIVVSNNSGSGGAALSRRRFGETVGVINTSFPHWFANNFNRYNGREDELPLDQHMLLALIAPRPLYVASAKEDLWADPEGEFQSILWASPAYELHGLEGLPVSERPELNKPVMGSIGYHIRTGVHNVTAWDIEQYLNFADLHFN